MGGKKKTEQTNTVSYGWQTAPETQDIRDLRSMQFQEDPGIGHQFALAKERIHNNYNNILGPYTTSDVRKKQLLAEDKALNQQEAAAHRQGQWDVNQQNYAKLMGLANLTQPKLVQNWGTQVTTQPTDIWGNLIGGAASVGSAALM